MSAITDSWIRRHRISVAEYYRMAEVGLLAQDAQVELIDGEVIDMAPIGSRHAAVVDRLARLLDRALGDSAVITTQRPLRLGTRSEPQPDVMILKPRADHYANAHPEAADVLLVVEVSDATLRYDRNIKVPLYAEHAIVELWLIDLNARQLHRFTNPSGSGYGTAASLQGGSIGPAAMLGVQIDLGQILQL